VDVRLTLGATLLLIGADAIACEVSLGRGWSSAQGGNGSIIVARDAPPCGAAMWIDPETRRPVTAIMLDTPPAQGVVSFRDGVLRYRPRRGFVGEDGFALRGTGADAQGRPADIRGRISVTVR